MTSTQLTSAATPITQLFGYGCAIGTNLQEVGTMTSGFNFQLGIPMMYGDRHGKKVVRADINGLGRLVSQAGFFNACGGYYTFDADVCEAIGGYPLGAILRYKDPSSGEVRTVRSQVADNTYNFVENPDYIDDVHWKFVDEVMPTGFRPRIFPIMSGGQSGTLNLGDTFKAARSGLFIIQTGPSKTVDAIDGDTAAYIWANVKKADGDSYHAAGMLAFLPPTSASYSMASRAVHSVYEGIESKAVYRAFYASSPIQIFLSPGDTVKTTANIELTYDVAYQFMPLTS